MWTLPNIITLVRICFTPVIALLPFIDGYWPKLIAFIIFIIAAVSDIYDGHLARSRNEVTDLGKLLDPIADKLLVASCLLMLAADGTIRGWTLLAAVIILCREILVSGLREFLAAPGQPGHQLADRGDTGGHVDIFVGLADALAHPGEIAELHVRCFTPARK